MKKSKRNSCYGSVSGKEKSRRSRSVVLTAAGLLSVLLLAGCGSYGRTGGSDAPRETEPAEAQAAGMESDGERAAEIKSAEMQETETESDEAQDTGMESDQAQDAGTAQAGEEEENRPATMANLLQESGNVLDTVDAPELPDTVLWFNATYACLTYTNGCDWRWVGGLEPTEENADKVKYLLRSSWNVTDRKSGIEEVKRLLGGGHRAKYQECIDDLEDWGLMDLNERQFLNEVTKVLNGERSDIDLGETPGRYVLAYYMDRDGISAEYIAAWDLCRVNQLYGDFYVCGFMSYEEAMDASYENSLRLQNMYDSWEEMMDAYLLGYQFWQGDLAASDDSPAKERRSYYEMLKKADDSPYELDWNMELKKSW